MESIPNYANQVNQLVEWYSGVGDAAPTREQWSRILSRDAKKPFALMNFFKFRDFADYGDGVSAKDVSGHEAFQSYARVSMPALQRAGGEFLIVGAFAGSFLGADENWDLIAVGRYPNLESFLALYTDEGYREAFRHRAAACSDQRVIVCEQS